MRKKFVVSICVVAILIAGIAVFVVLFGIQTAAVLSFKISKIECPVLYKTPEKIDLEDKIFTNGTTLSYFEYEFEAPWSDIKKKEIKDNFVWILFKSGKGIIIFSPKTSINLAQNFRSDNPKKAEMLSVLLGKELLQSNYGFYNTVLRVTPKDISIFRPRNQVMRASILLPLKLVFLSNSKSDLFEFKNQDFHGFQFGSPTASDQIILNLFDKKDQHLEMVVFVTKKEQVKLTQEEINHIILTLRSSSKKKN